VPLKCWNINTLLTVFNEKRGIDFHLEVWFIVVGDGNWIWFRKFDLFLFCFVFNIYLANSWNALLSRANRINVESQRNKEQISWNKEPMFSLTNLELIFPNFSSLMKNALVFTIKLGPFIVNAFLSIRKLQA